METENISEYPEVRILHFLWKTEFKNVDEKVENPGYTHNNLGFVDKF